MGIRTHVDACRPVALSHSCTMKSLQSWTCPRSPQTRATSIRAACCHSGLGTRPHYDHFGENVERRWLVRPASQASFKRFVRGDGWCFDVGCLRWANRWLGQGARERAFGRAARYVHGLRMAMGVEGSYTCGVPGQRNDNDTVVQRHGSGRVRGVFV